MWASVDQVVGFVVAEAGYSAAAVVEVVVVLVVLVLVPVVVVAAAAACGEDMILFASWIAVPQVIVVCVFVLEETIRSVVRFRAD